MNDAELAKKIKNIRTEILELSMHELGDKIKGAIEKETASQFKLCLLDRNFVLALDTILWFFLTLLFL